MCETEVNHSVSDIVAERIETERSWANLPDLLLYEIFSRVFVDHHRTVFCLVCKSWNSILESPIPTKDQFQLNATDSSCPYLFFTSKKLIHPILEKVHQLKKFPERTLGVQLCTAKEDWLLFAQNFYHGKPPKAFFYNPFTQTMVWLPDLLGNPDSMWFSSPPTSAEWTVVAIRSNIWSIGIDTIKCTEDRWTSCEFEFRENSSFEFSFCNPVLFKGMCYVLGKDSTLLIHDPKKMTFFLHSAPECLPSLYGEQYMLESDGKLLAVFANTDGSWVLVCRWNLTRRKWEKIESLGDKALFVSRPYSMSETVTTSGMKNRIYFPRLIGDHCLFYSLSTKRFHTLDGSSYNGFIGSKSAFSSTWIKPSCVTIC